MVGIGFFSPLPLAYMIPFMAAQSLAMGEAFGKGFQYGKRKISAQTNEEFNKFTFQNMWDEQNTNIRMLLPSLNSQLSSSIELQKAIFKHLFDMIPLFINEMAKSTNTLVQNLTFQNTGDSQNPAQDLVDYIKNIFNVPEANADAPPDNPFIGPPEPLPDTLKQHIEIQKQLKIPDPKSIPSSKVLSASQDPVYIAWITKLGQLKVLFNQQQASYDEAKAKTQGTSPNLSASRSVNKRQMAIFKSRAFGTTSQIRLMSQQYRDPNNHIRENALRLRGNMARWKLKL